MDLRPFAIFDLIIQTNKLAVAPYSPYQRKLHRIILDMRNNGYSYNAIANYMNENGLKTPRGKLFRNAHAHSIIKKKAIRDNRLDKVNEITIRDFDIIYM